MIIHFTDRTSKEVLLHIECSNPRQAMRHHRLFLEDMGQVHHKVVGKLSSFEMLGKIYENYDFNIHAEITL